MKAVVFTLGCKVNEVESQSIMAELESRGWEVGETLSYADVYILNTCAVTREAERKSRQLVSRALKFNSAASVYVCGCASQKNAAQFSSRGVKFVGGACKKEEVVNAVLADFGGGECVQLPYPKSVKTRAFIKIEDGCNNFCSYCVIPYLRGRVTSRPAQDILKEIESCSAPEIVLTGINISAYGGEGGLCSLISQIKTDRRIRLGSIECTVINDDFLLALSSLHDFAPQFHLSLQSGSNAVLKRMNRRYTREEYLDKCRKIYEYFPDAAITCDIIAGFCGETENDFSDSLKIIKEAGFARVHAFAFSPREGTAAYNMEDVPAQIKSERLHRLLAAADSAEKKYIGARLGNTYSVIFETFDGEKSCGYTGSYIKVYVLGNVCGMRNVTLNSLYLDGALGALAD